MAVQTLSYGTSPFTQLRVYTILCDTVSDLPSGTFDGVSITQGWTAKIIADGSTYLSNSSGTWVLQPSQQSQIILPDVYDKSEVDNLLAPIIDDITDIQAVDTRQDNVLENLIDTGSKNLVNAPTGTGTRFVNIPIVLQPGQYHVYFGTITTTDTDATTCQCAAFASDNTDASNYLQLQRIDGSNGLLTVTQTTSYVRLYASNNYANGNGDTVTFTNCMICKESDWQTSQTYVPYCPTLPELYGQVYVHDSTQVNLNDVTWTRSGGGLYYSSTITIPNSPVRLLYHATLSGFSNLRATDIITPACRRSGGWTGFVLYANTNSFLTSAWVTVSVSGLP